MKLRNKKTGEIRELPDGFFCGDNLKKICEEWEDYEEPKGYWFIDCAAPYPVDFCEFNEDTEDDKKIGNYFETKEEAEKAVEKLKAWKRLKDEYDFKFTGWKRDEQFRGDFIITAQDWNTSDDKLLDLLFGGEE